MRTRIAALLAALGLVFGAVSCVAMEDQEEDQEEQQEQQEQDDD